MLPVVLAAALALAAVYFVLKPIFQGRTGKIAPAPPSPVERLRREKEGIYLAIREVEFDHRTGVVSDEDHAALIARYKARAIELMQEIDRLEAAAGARRAADTVAEAAVAAQAVDQEIGNRLAADPRTAAPLPRCPACDTEALPVHRFCTRCGHAFPEEAAGSAAAAGKRTP